MRFLLAALCVLTGQAAASFAQELDHTMYRMPIPGGFAVTPDLVTLIVAQPESAELVFFDTLKEAESRRVEMEFQPAAMAVNDKSLFVVGKGSSVIYQVDLKTAEVQKEFSIEGDGISRIAVHPQRPLLFVSTANLEIFTVDLTNARSRQRKASGDYLAVAPDGNFLFTGMQPRSSHKGLLLITETPDGVHFIYDRWGIRSAIAKYKIKGMELELTSSQPNASVNGYAMHLSPDGKRVMMTGRGGWRPPAEGGTGGGDFTAVWSTGNLKTRLGQAPPGEAVVYHPVLNLGAASGLGHQLLLFDGKSFKERQKIVFSEGGHGGRDLLAFVGKGTKVALHNGANPRAYNEGLHFIDITLSEAERAQLEKAYGTLPEPLVAARETESPETTTPETTTPDTPEESPAVATTTGSKLKTAPKSGQTKTAKGPQVAKSGFNDAQGINSDKRTNSPYPLETPGDQPGVGEAGWAGPWNAQDNMKFQKEVVDEGDGAMFIRGTCNAVRRLAHSYRGRVRIEHSVRMPADGDLKFYANQADFNTAAMWFATKGKFQVLDGAEDQYARKPALDAFDCEPDTWYKIAVEIDYTTKTWTFAVDGKQFEHPGLHFRGRPEFLQEINILTETPAGVYIDALQVTALPAAPQTKGTAAKK